jgi:hypothetical protein
MFLIGTQDARGFRQLKKAGRYVKKGSKAFYILVPYLVKTENQKKGETEDFLKGILCKLVFRAEDTTGEPLDYEQIDLPDLPFIRKVEEWGVSVKAIPDNYRYYGYYSSIRKEIALATPRNRYSLINWLMWLMKKLMVISKLVKIHCKKSWPSYRLLHFAGWSAKSKRIALFVTYR